MKYMVRIVVILGILFSGSFFILNHQVTSSHGRVVSSQVIEIVKGDNVLDVGNKLQDTGIISWRGYFVYYIWKEDLRHRLTAGKYQLNGSMTIPDIATIITSGEVIPKGVTVTFPEGFDSLKMADRLTANALPGDAFLELVNHPLPVWREQFWFLKNIPTDASLEGFLFPDTYTFTFDATPENIVTRMLTNFGKKFPDGTKVTLEEEGKNIFDVVTLASIVENEVQTASDRKVVADIFWRRLSIGQPLQSDATVKYVNKESKIQHSFEETRVDSPYNTYVHKGLPPGPISNPGIESIQAVVFPTPNQYFYFLTDTTTGETVFSVTFDEHIANKAKHGL